LDFTAGSLSTLRYFALVIPRFVLLTFLNFVNDAAMARVLDCASALDPDWALKIPAGSESARITVIDRTNLILSL
jgi:hypothetical protein